MTSKQQTAKEILIGKELFAFIKKKQSFFDWKSKLLKISTLNPKLQTQIFKFVDVLPNLKNKESIVEVLTEYIDESDLKLGSAIKIFSKLPIIDSLFKTLVESCVGFLAKTFICGENIDEAKNTIKKLKLNKQFYTLDLLGEKVFSQKEADYYFNEYIELIKNIPQANISIKLSAIVTHVNGHNYETKKSILIERLSELYRLAIKHDATINVDSEHYEWHEFIFEIVKEVLAKEEFLNFNRAGIVIQAYLKESKKDLEAWIAWSKKNNRRITIRLVKGAYWDYENAIAKQHGWQVPVFEDKALTDINYEQLTEILLSNTKYIRPAIASHNVRSLANAIKIAQEKHIDKKDFEFQMLFGMLDELKDYFSNNGYCLRVYLPYGKLIPGMSYLVRRLLENTANDSFLKQGFIDKKAQDELLKAPLANEKLDIKNNNFENIPNLYFAQKFQRDDFAKYLQKLKAELNKEKLCPIIVAGKEIYTEESFTSTNPANNSEILATIFKASTNHCDMAIEQAQMIQKKWLKLDIENRAKVLLESAKEINRRRYFFNSILVLESGKAWHEADAETCEVIDFLNYYAKSAVELFSNNKLRSLTGEKNTNLYQAYGISLIISPWNFPLAITIGMAVANLVCGNAILIKPSSQTCLIAYEALSIILEKLKNICGKQYEALISFLPGSGAVIGEYLINHPKVNAISFTGSNTIGMHINDVVNKSRPVKKLTAEMGGKNPIIVDRTADLDEAIPAVLYSAFGFSGQKCSACSRVIVEEEIYNEFKTRLVAAAESIKVDDPQNPEVYTGPVIDRAAKQNILDYIELAKQEGDVLFYNEHFNSAGHYINPLIVENLIANSKVAKEEIFGPVLALFKAKNLDHAIELANNTHYGLTAACFSRSPQNIQKLSQEIQAGNFYINRSCTGAVVSRQAFGGLKNSSIGFKAGGPNYLLQFVQEKTITENTMRRGFVDDGDNKF